ncbi:MAG: ROK family protein [Chloroflexi bacterium]|nr:ROK family protein [Chloroflexota bacterium]
MGDQVLAIDFGGTQTRAAVIDAEGRLLSRARADTRVWEGRDAVLARLLQTARNALAQAPQPSISAVGLSAPGPINPQTGLIYTAPNMPGWVNVPLSEILAAEFGVPVFAGNDANLAALAEARFGAGRNYRHIVYLTVSTGIGSGIISDGVLVTGKDGLAAEAGHLILEPDGPPCGCGGRGCLEALASGSSIARAAEARLAQGDDSVLQAKRGTVTSRLVAEAAQRGDRLAGEVFQRAATYLGLGVAALINLFNPQIIILGGGVTNAGDLLFDTVTRVALSRCMPILSHGVQIVPAALRDDVGLRGAAIWAFTPRPRFG